MPVGIYPVRLDQQLKREQASELRDQGAGRMSALVPAGGGTICINW
jgi:hypothetical protein